MTTILWFKRRHFGALTGVGVEDLRDVVDQHHARPNLAMQPRTAGCVNATVAPMQTQSTADADETPAELSHICTASR